MDVRIVVTLKGETAIIGIQQPDCDPVFHTIQGGLPGALEAVPRMLAEAQERWQTNPKYPKTEAKLESPPTPQPQPARQQSAGRSASRQQAHSASGQQALL
ncbi:MAG: hypothetical protein HYX84_02595 [Chloroflexi bacterium]|nr:hypothetical protein [Chloroflexota bacterium]